MVTVGEVGEAGVRNYMGTLTAGAELHPALCEVAKAKGVHIAAIYLLGGLSKVRLTSSIKGA